MRFLIDASLSPVVADRLRAAGHDAVHVGEALRVDAPDSAVLDHAAEHERVIVAADTDFGTLLARRSTSKPSFVLFRRQTGRRPAVQAALLLDHLRDIERDLEAGAVVVIEEGRIRVRQLPVNP
jgi:predicted nuclease of predicted toxin-antitoxin system